MRNIAAELLELGFRLFENEIERKRLKKEVERIKNECKHEIIITTCETDLEIMTGFKKSGHTECLICGEYLNLQEITSYGLKEKIKNAIHIDFNKYCNLSDSWKKTGIAILKSYYFLEKARNEDLTEHEIGEKVLKRFEEEIEKEGAYKIEE